jgi:hypothetical protein
MYAVFRRSCAVKPGRRKHPPDRWTADSTRTNLDSLRPQCFALLRLRRWWLLSPLRPRGRPVSRPAGLVRKLAGAGDSQFVSLNSPLLEPSVSPRPDVTCMRALVISHGGDWGLDYPYDSMPAFQRAGATLDLPPFGFILLLCSLSRSLTLPFRKFF